MVEIVLILLALLIVPFVVYLSVKLGTYGYLMAKYRFRLDHPEERKEEHG